MPTKNKYRKLWEAALCRNGKQDDFYLQTQGYLWMPAKFVYEDGEVIPADAFCCLGVGRNILVESGQFPASQWTECDVALTNAERRLLQISKRQHDQLCAMNDTRGLTFKGIALQLIKWEPYVLNS
jgi:hypothetical protein